QTTKTSKKVVCHFYVESSEMCKILDMHLKKVAAKHVEAKFVKLNAEKAHFLVKRLNIKVMPTMAVVIDSIIKDYIIGFSDLGNTKEFPTSALEWRLAQSQVIDSDGDELKPTMSNVASFRSRYINTKSNLRRNEGEDESDSEED
ncbi:hypothetical protein SNEBB_004856, partial [Seison nebaliae]